MSDLDTLPHFIFIPQGGFFTALRAFFKQQFHHFKFKTKEGIASFQGSPEEFGKAIWANHRDPSYITLPVHCLRGSTQEA